jgi:hypothetical protein
VETQWGFFISGCKLARWDWWSEAMGIRLYLLDEIITTSLRGVSRGGLATLTTLVTFSLMLVFAKFN